MTKEEVFSAWAPESSCWSQWVKPVLFAYLDCAPPAMAPQESPGAPASSPASGDVSRPPAGTPALPVESVPEPKWVPPIESRCALVLDLPGAEGVLLGLELAVDGYRPVPLYNAVPMPYLEPVIDPITHRRVAAVHVLPIVVALRDGAAILGKTALPADAPPVFLLDAHRRGDGRKMLPDEFDNRSVCFTTDFPSANFLSAQRINRVVLVQQSGEQPQLDLAHVLRRWQQAGITIQLKRLDVPGPPVPCQIARPSWFGMMFQRALVGLGLRRGGEGGFGAWITASSAGG